MYILHTHVVYMHVLYMIMRSYDPNRRRQHQEKVRSSSLKPKNDRNDLCDTVLEKNRHEQIVVSKDKIVQ